MPDQPTLTLERVAYLEHLVHIALEDFASTEHGILWDALLDARAALAAAVTVVTAVQLEDVVLTRPAAVCTACGNGLPELVDATSRDDHLRLLLHHELGECAPRSSNGTGDE